MLTGYYMFMHVERCGRKTAYVPPALHVGEKAVPCSSRMESRAGLVVSALWIERASAELRPAETTGQLTS